LEHTKASAASRAAALEAHLQDKCEELVVRVTENVDLQNRLADKKSELEEKVGPEWEYEGGVQKGSKKKPNGVQAGVLAG
jgi:hypothetical protein